MAKQAPTRQFPTDSGKDIDTAQISKAFEGRLTPNGGPFAHFFSRVLSHSGMGGLSTFPAYSGFPSSPFLSFYFYVISCAFYRNVLWFTTVCLLGFGRGLRSSHPASPLYLYLSCLNHSYEAPLARSVSDTILRIDLPISNVCSVLLVYAISKVR